jgi:hypothetical protein
MVVVGMYLECSKGEPKRKVCVTCMGEKASF